MMTNRCRRLHFFTVQIDATAFQTLLDTGEDTAFLQEGYLGFIVARPLATALIGRTVIRTYPPDCGRRNYPCVRKYRVNLFGIELTVDSLAFQEQDTSLAACATVALWSCFQKTRDLFNSGLPSPVQITREANRFLISSRPFPSRGLRIEQVCNAIAAEGLDPEVYHVTPDLPLVSMAYSYLKLGLPVLLIVDIPKVGLHGVALNGYSLCESNQLVREGGSEVLPPLIGLRINEFYAHDDQVGPFSRLRIVEAPDAQTTVQFSTPGWKSNLKPVAVVVPIYPKIRTGFRDAIKWIPMISTVVSWTKDASEFEWDIYLISSNSLKRDLRLGQIQMSTSLKSQVLVEGLPKYLWRCSLRVANASVFEMLLDTTAMVNGFPIARLWWVDEGIKDIINPVLTNPTLQTVLAQVLTTRLLTALQESCIA
jgi:hypothetical protein